MVFMPLRCKIISIFMKTTIGVCNTHREAMEAVRELRKAGYPTKNLSVIGKVDADTEDDIEVTDMKVAGTEVGAGVVIGSTLGILTGVGVFAIPGLGFLFGAGALAGAIAGFDIGLIGGGIVSALTLTGIHDEKAKHYDEQLKEGKFLLIVQGSKEEGEQAQKILQAKGGNAGLEMH